MKYLLGMLAIGLVVGSVHAQNVSVVAETGEFVSVPAAATAFTSASVAQVSTATNVVPTAFTPAYVGQLLIGTVSNVLYVAKTTDTNGWLKVTIE